MLCPLNHEGYKKEKCFFNSWEYNSVKKVGKIKIKLLTFFYQKCEMNYILLSQELPHLKRNNSL
ncbi:conserved hypothetical protein [Desulfamplus magnetovallimortis]|uniref:Uncharacterized protein n=1 Tax=Desulfamplus magnetovallimortis TaxID=1246637 RepID=A0A1W1HDV4_9BACT|nr:conserved hypothetical protein [Desulfamplus magnetovallimortis]